MTRARVTLPDDQPDYGDLMDLTADERTALPARFHTPVWHGRPPGEFVCRVCPDDEDGYYTPWPCVPAREAGPEVLTRQRRGPQISRPNYDKRHRCPGWSGGGWVSARYDQCDNGYIKIDYDSRWWPWRFHRCTRCTVLVLPDVVRWLDPTWLLWWISSRLVRELIQWWEDR